MFISISCSFLILGYKDASGKYQTEASLVEKNESALAKQTAKFINDYLQSKITVVNSVANMIENQNLTIDNKVLVNQLMLGNKAGGFAAMYLGLEDSGDLIRFNGIVKTIKDNNYDARTRPWYKKAMETQASGVTEPFVDNNTKRLIITVYSPYKKDGKFIGAIGATIFLDTIVKEILNLKLGEDGFAYLLSNDGKIIIHKNKELLKKDSLLFKGIRSDEDNKFAEATENGVKNL